MNKVAIYAGAFNPPTIAHKWVITHVLEKTDIDKIVFCPSGPREDKDYWIANDVREKLLRIFYEDLQSDWLPVDFSSFFFTSKNHKNTTARWVDAYMKTIYGPDIYHIFWSDVIKNMEDWSDNPNRFVQTELKKIFANRAWYESDFNGIENYIQVNLPDELDGISSTLVRTRIKNKHSIRDIVTSWVCDFLENSHWLYQDRD